MKKLLNLALNSLYPQKTTCIVCGSKKRYRNKSICTSCLSLIEYMNGLTCLSCGKSLSEDYAGAYSKCPDCRKHTHYYDAAYSCFEYKNMGKNLIHKLKYENKVEIADILGDIVAKKIRAENLSTDVIIPIPIHERKLLSRGFNQSLLIAESVSTRIGIPVCDCLKRIKETENQYSLDKMQRMLNVYDAFTMDILYNRGSYKRAILLDDVYTTGSTVNECSRILKQHGFQHVIVVACATGSNT